MDYETDVTVIVRNGKEKSTHVFENENIQISRATSLWIKNIANKESELFETIKLWFAMDQDTKTTSYYQISTSKSSPVQSFRTLYVHKIDNEKQTISFKWFEE